MKRWKTDELYGAGATYQNGSVPPWQQQSPAQAAPPAVQQPPQQQGSLKRLPAAGKQPGKIGFFIKPQLPRSKQAQAAAPAYVKVEDSKPKVTPSSPCMRTMQVIHIAGTFSQLQGAQPCVHMTGPPMQCSVIHNQQTVTNRVLQRS